MAAFSKHAFAGVFYPLLMLYMIIGCNFLANLFSCRVQRLLTENQAVRHVVGFMTLYICIVLATGDSERTGLSARTRLMFAIGLYVLFMLTTRMKHEFWMAFMALLLVVAALEIAQREMGDYDADTNPDGLTAVARERYVDTQVALGGIALGVLVVGVGWYIHEKRQEYGADFNMVRFIIGNSKCKNNGNGTAGTDLESSRS